METTEKTGKVKISRTELFYYLFFGILFAAKGVGMTEGEKLFTLCMLAAAACLAVKLCLTAHTIKEWIVMAALVLLGVLIYLSSGEKAAVFAVLVIIGMKNIPVKRLFSVCLGIWSVTFSFSVIMGLLHIRDGVVVVHEKLGLGPIIRWSLGYTHPNVLHVSYFILAALILYNFECKGKKAWKTYAVLFAGNLLVFLYSVSYTGVLLTTGYLGLHWYLVSRKRLTMPEKGLLVCIMPFCVIFPLAGPFLLKGRAFAFFNNLLSYRFELVYNIFHENPICLIGKGFVNTGGGKLTLDSSFAYLLMYYGILAFLLFAGGYFLMVLKLAREDGRKELALVTGITVAGITEQFLFNLSFKNLSFFFLGDYLFRHVLRTGNKERLWNREILFLHGGGEMIVLPDITGWLRGGASMLAARKSFSAAVILAAAFLGAAVCAKTVRLPDSIYVERWATDYRNEKEEKLLDLSRIPEDFNSMVIGYSGPETGMYEFTGNIIKLEYVRDITGACVLAAGAAGMCVLVIAAAAEKKKRKRA